MSEKPPDKGNTNGVKPEGSKSDEEPTALEAGNSASCSTASALLEESKRGEEFARLEARNNASGSTSGVKPEGSKSDEELAVLEAGNSASWNTSGALPGESKSDEELAVLEAGNNASCSGSSVKPEGSQSDEEPTVLEAENNASSVVRELTIKSSELQHPTERGSTTADTDPHESGELELSQTRLAIQLSREVLRGYPTDKLEELVKELGRKFEIFGPEDLICLTDAQLDEIETVKTVQKRKLRSYVKRIQTDGATSGNFNEPTHSEDTNTEGMAVPVGAAPSGLVPEAKQADKIQPPRTPFQSSSQNFPKAERWEDAAGNEVDQ